MLKITCENKTMANEHVYKTNIIWTGNLGGGTKSYTGYSRAHEISIEGKPIIVGSSDPHFNGDASRYNPEELLVASLSSCQMLWYLHLCAKAGIVVVHYQDAATGTMIETKNGGGRFVAVSLAPRVTIVGNSNQERAKELQHEAHELCFIANSVNFPVRVEAEIVLDQDI
jgi:organic hydroperoxide reductase OsmC/OhrA